MDFVKPRVLALGRYAIDVEPIPSRNRNNREVHLDYLKHLKESVETLHEIVEEAKVERPLDRSLASACLYTKHSQELLEYVIGTCLKDFYKRDKKHAYTPLTRKKQVTFEDQCETKCIPPVKNVMRKVKKVWKPKQVKQVWKATGKVLTYVGYQWKPTRRIFTLGDQCPLTRLTISNVLPVQQTKNVSTSKTVITEKLSNNSQKSLTSYQRRNKQHKAIPTSISTPTMNQAIDTSMPTDVVQIVLWYLDSGCSKYITGDRSWLRNFVKKFIGIVRFINDHFGAIMGYGDYVIGDSVISRVYYVEGLRHNLFSVR
ncbi:hypothetical protein Tco_1361765 [Tanacetum coccineum]